MNGFERAATTYDRYRWTLEPDRRHTLVTAGLEGGAGKRALDLGTGTGVMAFVLADHHYRVTGIDSSKAMLKEAATRARSSCADVRFLHLTMPDTRLRSDSFDLITASQSWHLFDTFAALAEVKRLLRPDGKILIATFDWLPHRGGIVERTEEIIRSLDHSWKGHSGDGRHPAILAKLGEAGFETLRTGEKDSAVEYTIEDWVGRVGTSSVGGAHPDENVASEIMSTLTEALRASRHTHGPATVTYRAWWVVAHISANVITP